MTAENESQEAYEQREFTEAHMMLLDTLYVQMMEDKRAQALDNLSVMNTMLAANPVLAKVSWRAIYDVVRASRLQSGEEPTYVYPPLQAESL